jgi:hypothetical protein
VCSLKKLCPSVTISGNTADWLIFRPHPIYSSVAVWIRPPAWTSGLQERWRTSSMHDMPLSRGKWGSVPRL